MRTMSDDWQLKLDNFVRQRDRLTSETAKLRQTIESQQGAIHKAEVAASKYHTELQSTRERPAPPCPCGPRRPGGDQRRALRW